jgi:type I restriction enzyme S subunit
MSKYQAYPDYKDSGVEWLDVVPSHWLPASLKMLVDVRDGTHDTPEYVEIGTNTFPLVTSKDVTSGTLHFDLCKHISDVDYLQIIKRSKVDIGDILMPMIGTVGFPVLVKHNDQFAIKNLALFKTAHSNKIHAPFLNYFLQSQECNIQFSLESRGGVQNFVSLGTLRNLGFSNPPVFEQFTIANFLDHETAKIDTLIEQQQQLIQLLKEKRQAVISHAVTKGLNPDAPMKDSGVEWLGEVPAHWDIIKAGYIGRFFGSEAIADEHIVTDGDLPFIKVSSLSSEFFSVKDFNWFVSREKARTCTPEIDYLAFPKRGAAIFTNKVNIVRELSVVDPNLMGWKMNDFALIEFVAFLLKLRGLADIADVSTVPQINNKHIAPEKFPVPPIAEQQEIICYLNHETIRFDNLIEKSESAILIMQERRTALISAAVTGKIDVRNWQAPNN